MPLAYLIKHPAMFHLYIADPYQVSAKFILKDKHFCFVQPQNQVI